MRGYFGGLRETVLERDGYACQICGASGRDKRSITVHHRVPGRSLLHLMISLCPGAIIGIVFALIQDGIATLRQLRAFVKERIAVEFRPAAHGRGHYHA